MHFLASLEHHPQLVEAYVEQTQQLWAGGQTPEVRRATFSERLTQWSPGFDMCGLVSAQRDLVSSLLQYYFPLSIGSTTHDCVGLGGIFTHPSHRNLGHAQRLITLVLEHAAQTRGCNYALLFSDIGVEYYQRFGFRPLPASNWTCEAHALPSVEPFQIQRARPGDVQALVARHAHCEQQAPGRVARTAATWHMFHTLNGVDEDVFLLDGGEPVGQLSLTHCQHSGYLWIEEWHLSDNYSSARPVNRLWSTLRALALQDNVTTVRGWVLPAQALPPQASLQARVKQVPMLASLNPALSLLPANELAHVFVSSLDHF